VNARSEWKAMHELCWLGRLSRKLELALTGHWTYCDECKRFSPERYCPWC
jgi:hypothetical protein